MKALITLIVFIILFILLVTFWNKKQKNKISADDSEKSNNADNNVQGMSGCCGGHDHCKEDKWVDSCKNEIEYFNDEELDRFKYKNSSDYNSDEIDEFREIFYTVLDREKSQWIKSLEKREISIPDQMKDEVIAFIKEANYSKSS